METDKYKLIHILVLFLSIMALGPIQTPIQWATCYPWATSWAGTRVMAYQLTSPTQA